MKLPDSTVINEVQLLLAEKRTTLSVMRTGIAVLALPISVLSLLVATSKYYDILHVLHLFIPLALINTGLFVLGVFLVTRAVFRMRRYDQMIQEIKTNHRSVGQFIE